MNQSFSQPKDAWLGEAFAPKIGGPSFQRLNSVLTCRLGENEGPCKQGYITKQNKKKAKKSVHIRGLCVLCSLSQGLLFSVSNPLLRQHLTAERSNNTLCELWTRQTQVPLVNTTSLLAWIQLIQARFGAATSFFFFFFPLCFFFF